MGYSQAYAEKLRVFKTGDRVQFRAAKSGRWIAAVITGPHYNAGWYHVKSNKTGYCSLAHASHITVDRSGAREDRAHEVAETYKFRTIRLSPRVVVEVKHPVETSRRYRVEQLAGGDWVCECSGFAKSEDRCCKHVLALSEHGYSDPEPAHVYTKEDW